MAHDGRHGALAADGAEELSSLEQTLQLEQIADCDIFVGQPREEARHGKTRTHLFGGLIAAQSVAAAGRTVPLSHRIHSLHSYFILAGDGRTPILFNVTRTRDGGSFKTRQVTAMQENRTTDFWMARWLVPAAAVTICLTVCRLRGFVMHAGPIFVMTASFHKHEKGPEFQRPPQQVFSLLRELLPRSGGRLPTPKELIADGRRIDKGLGATTWTIPVLTGYNHSLAWHKHAHPRKRLRRGASAAQENADWLMHW
jgi:hypothetical protein